MKEGNFPKAKAFYETAFSWNNKDEVLYNKLLRILGAQGKSMQAIRKAVKHILETSFKSGDAELGEKQLLLIVDLAEQKFK